MEMTIFFNFIELKVGLDLVRSAKLRKKDLQFKLQFSDPIVMEPSTPSTEPELHEAHEA